MASPGKPLYFLSRSTEQKLEDDAALSGVATSLGQKICCYQTHVSLALWGYASTKIKRMLLGLKEEVKPERKSGAGHHKEPQWGARWIWTGWSLPGR